MGTTAVITHWATRPGKRRPVGDREHAEALALGIDTRPVLVGPATLLLLAKAAPGAPPGFRPFDRLDDLIDVYADILAALADAGVGWVQLDEPAYVADRSTGEIDALRAAYSRLGGLSRRPRLFVASYFGELGGPRRRAGRLRHPLAAGARPGEIADALGRAARAVPADRLWVNPDCGLKTRGYDEVERALAHLVAAAVEVRAGATG